MFVLWAINACVIERFQATRRVGGVSNLTCAGILAANTSLRGVEVKHVRDEQTRDPLIDFCRRCSRSHRISSRLLEAGEADHVVESITGHLSRRMLEHYSHIRLNAKKAHSITGRHLQL